MNIGMKEKILGATLELAYEKGLGRVSVSQIAQRVGLKKSSIYSHFSSKEEIIEEMYLYYRNRAKQGRGDNEVDYGKLVEGRSLKEILFLVVASYRELVSDEQMRMFYKVIMSERAINPVAAEIMVTETNTMVRATKQLFYAMQAKSVAQFTNPDAAAFSFAMGIHSIIDFMGDAEVAGSRDAEGKIEEYIEEFSRVYGTAYGGDS